MRVILLVHGCWVFSFALAGSELIMEPTFEIILHVPKKERIQIVWRCIVG